MIQHEPWKSVMPAEVKKTLPFLLSQQASFMAQAPSPYP
jgi:hypothetical protein